MTQAHCAARLSPRGVGPLLVRASPPKRPPPRTAWPYARVPSRTQKYPPWISTASCPSKPSSKSSSPLWSALCTRVPPPGAVVYTEEPAILRHVGRAAVVTAWGGGLARLPPPAAWWLREDHNCTSPAPSPARSPSCRRTRRSCALPSCSPHIGSSGRRRRFGSPSSSPGSMKMACPRSMPRVKPAPPMLLARAAGTRSGPVRQRRESKSGTPESPSSPPRSGVLRPGFGGDSLGPLSSAWTDCMTRQAGQRT